MRGYRISVCFLAKLSKSGGKYRALVSFSTILIFCLRKINIYAVK